jgi:hypothetical protein
MLALRLAPLEMSGDTCVLVFTPWWIEPEEVDEGEDGAGRTSADDVGREIVPKRSVHLIGP